MSNIIYKAFTDGSFNGTNSSWAYVIIDDKENIIKQDKGILDGKINSMHQIGGEIFAVQNAVFYCKENNLKCEIHHDYIGIKHWVADIWGEKPWKAKNEWTKAYREFILNNKEVIHSMVWVKSHADNKWNNFIDKIVKI